MLKNHYEIKKHFVQAKTHIPIKWQLASKNNKSDEILKNNIFGAIILKSV